MTDLMQMLYDYILSDRAPRHIDQVRFNNERRQAERLREELAAALPEPELLRNYQDTMDFITGMESEAIFQATFDLARELA